MKIKKLKRVVFKRNPIVEIIGQIKFPQNAEIQNGLPVKFQKEVSRDFPFFETQELKSVSFELENNLKNSRVRPENSSYLFNFLSENKKLRVSLARDFLALTSIDYKSWDIFFPKLEAVFQTLLNIYSIPLVVRLGLRYKNVIDRNKLNMADKGWDNLVHNSAMGHLTNKDLFDGKIEDSNIFEGGSVTHLKLDDFSLILQTGFVGKENGEKCFVIDADHYNKKNLKIDDLDFKKEFDILHDQAGAIFRNCIKEPLHHALEPQN